MLRAYRGFDRFRPGTNARAWLLKIVYRLFVNDYHRKRRVPPAVPIDELETRYGIELIARAGAFEAATWTEPEVEAALDELPDAFRAAVLLVDIEDLSYEDAAAALECEIGTVRSRLFRARRLLAARLEAYARDRGIGTRREGAR